MTNVGTIRCAMGGQLTLRCTLWSSNLLEMWQFASIRDDFLRSLYRLYRCVWYRCVWMPFFLVTSSYAICTSLTYFDRCILTLYGIGALQTCFFLWSTPSKSALFSQIAPSNKGNLLLSIQDSLLCFGGSALFFWLPLSKCDYPLVHVVLQLGLTSIDIASIPVTFARHIWRNCRSLINIGIRKRCPQLQGGETSGCTRISLFMWKATYKERW